LSRRLFVALDLPDAARDALAAFRAEAADPDAWRPVADEALHVTLAFLGHRPEEDAAVAEEVLERVVSGGAPRLRLGPSLTLPPRRPRVLTAEVEDLDGTLGELQAAVSGGLAAAGLYEPEARAFRPHVTVARVRSGVRPRRAELPGPEPVEFRGERVTLYDSRRMRGGARYEALSGVEWPRS